MNNLYSRGGHSTNQEGADDSHHPEFGGAPCEDKENESKLLQRLTNAAANVSNQAQD